MTSKSLNYLSTVTTVSPLTVVRKGSSPAFPPTLGFFLRGHTLKLEVSVAKAIRREHGRKGAKDDRLPLEPLNFKIIGGGIVIIALGYLALSADSVEGFLPLTVAPILLVLGYCVILPLGIMYRKGLFARKKEMPPVGGQEG